MLTKSKLCIYLLSSVVFIVSGNANAISFNEALGSAYKNNPTLQSMRESVKSSDEDMPTALSGFMPSVSASINRGNTDREVGGAASDGITEDRELRLQQPLFRGGKTISEVKQAKNLIKASRSDLREVEQQVLLEAATAYMDIIRDTEVLELAKNKIDVMQTHLDVTKERFSLGEVTKTDVAQAESAHATSVSEKINAEGALEASRASFKRVTGEEPIDLESGSPVSVQATLDEMIEIALKENPTVRSAEYTKEAAENIVSSEKSDLLPNLDFLATKSQEKGSVINNNDIESETISLNLTVPLYQGGSEYSDVRRAKANLGRLKYDLNDQRNTIRESVIRAYNDVEVAKAVIESDKAAVAASEVALEGTQQETKVGSRTTLDLLDAEQELYQVKADLIRAKRDEVVSSYSLLAQVGRLNAAELGLNVEIYDPEKNYNKRKYQIIGF